MKQDKIMGLKNTCELGRDPSFLTEDLAYDIVRKKYSKMDLRRQYDIWQDLTNANGCVD